MTSTRQRHGTVQSIIDRTEPAATAKNLAAVALGKLGGLKGGKAAGGGASLQAASKTATAHATGSRGGS